MKELFVAPFLFFALVGAETALAKPVVHSPKGVAIGGYDPVAYFEKKGEQLGKAEHASQHEKATWYFVSAANKAAFDKEPGKYAPQYGGWCAYAMSRGDKAKIDPKAWTIHDGKLYLNYSLDIMKKWRKNMANYINNADGHWPKAKFK